MFFNCNPSIIYNFISFESTYLNRFCVYLTPRGVLYYCVWKRAHALGLVFGLALVLKFMKKYFPCVYKVSFMPVIDPVSNTVGRYSVFFHIVSLIHWPLFVSLFCCHAGRCERRGKRLFLFMLPIGSCLTKLNVLNKATMQHRQI